MSPIDRRGMWVAVGAYVLWGVMPLYWHLLKTVPSLQIVLHRIAWSALFVGGYLLWRDGRGWLRRSVETLSFFVLRLGVALTGKADSF